MIAGDSGGAADGTAATSDEPKGSSGVVGPNISGSGGLGLDWMVGIAAPPPLLGVGSTGSSSVAGEGAGEESGEWAGEYAGERAGE